MLGSIEELEKEIEQFQNNMMASGEIVTLLKQMLEQIKGQNDSFTQKSSSLVSKVDSLPATIETANETSNAKIKADVAAELGQVVLNLRNEQNRYLQGLEQTRQQIQDYIDRADSQEKVFNDKIGNLLEKLDSAMDQIQEDNKRTNDELKKAVDKLLAERNTEFAEEQGKYISSLQQTQGDIKSAEERLDVTYKEFVDTLQKMNISNLYAQNQQIQSKLNKRTIILTVLSILCLIACIVGIFI